MRIRSGDEVVVITGKDRSKAPRKVLRVVADGQKVVVEGVNRVYKHVKKGHPKSPAGGRLQLEMPVDSSNIQFYCRQCNRGVRIGVRFEEDGSKVRFCKKCSVTIGVVSPAKPAYAQAPTSP